MPSLDWNWVYKGQDKNRWQSKIVVGIDGVFINKKTPTNDHERIMYFSKELGLLSCLSRMYYKIDNFELQETKQRCYIHNQSDSVFNHVDKDDYDYIKFASTQKAIITLEQNFGENYIIGVSLEPESILKELLEC